MQKVAGKKRSKFVHGCLNRTFTEFQTLQLIYVTFSVLPNAVHYHEIPNNYVPVLSHYTLLEISRYQIVRFVVQVSFRHFTFSVSIFYRRLGIHAISSMTL